MTATPPYRAGMRYVAALATLLALVAAPAGSTASSRAAKCAVSTSVQGGRGTASFTGTCNRLPYSLKVDPYSVAGRLGRATVSFKRTGETLTGRLGTTRSHLSYKDAAITGRVGKSLVRLDVFPAAVNGRVGAQHVTCTFLFLKPLGEKITCTGGGSEAVVPFLALLYAAP